MAAPMTKVVAVACMLLLLAVGLSVGDEDGGVKPGANACSEQLCVGETREVPAHGACICSRNCACAGMCLTHGENATSCFIDCVLKNGCVCTPKKDGELVY